MLVVPKKNEDRNVQKTQILAAASITQPACYRQVGLPIPR